MKTKLFLFVTLFFSLVSSYAQEVYKSVKIGSQVWMAENLNVDHYLNGDSIPQVQDPVQWAKLTTGAWCYYENKTENGTKYGKLYNAYAILDPRGLAPDGWHLPSDEEWEKMAIFLGGNEAAGLKIRSTSGCKPTTIMKSTNGTNTSGFNGLLAGFRKSDGSFTLEGTGAYWWIYPPSWMVDRNKFIENYHATCYNNRLDRGTSDKVFGLPVRCVKD